MSSTLNHNFIVPVFLAHESCPGRCVFCRVQAHTKVLPQRVEPGDVDAQISRYLTYPKNPPARVELAFYGASFTLLDGSYRHRLLAHVRDLKHQGVIQALRVSTRPDALNDKEVAELVWAGVDTVEIGAQSFDEAVLLDSRRGHTAQAIRQAVGRLQASGLKTGIHLMIGLPGDTREKFVFSLRETISLKPEFVRLHPTLVLAETPLALAMEQGKYRPLSREEALWSAKTALLLLARAGIPVARLGLQETDELRNPGVIVGGYHNPDFRSEVEEEIFFDFTRQLAARRPLSGGLLAVRISWRDVSAFVGKKRRNLARLSLAMAPDTLTFTVDHQLSRGWVVSGEGNNLVKENIYTQERNAYEGR